MARYDIQKAWYRTPNGRSALMMIRESTNDHNTCQSSMTEDEYGLRGLDVTGRAIDVGGYLGSVAIGLLIDHPDLLVDCVEPIPENAALIRLNADLNGVADRLTLHEAAVGDGSPVTIHYAYEGSENDLHHAFVGNAATADAEGVHRTVTVPSLTPDFWSDDVSLLKIDCENGEWAFFASGPTHRFRHIVGERHPGGGTREDFRVLLPYHEVTFTGPEAGPDEFRAVLRPHAGELPSSFPATS